MLIISKMRSKKEKIRKETWKYFWKQKIIEIGIVILIIPFLYGMAKLTRFLDVLWTKEPQNLLFPTMNSFGEYVLYGVIGILFTILFGMFVFLIGYLLYLFIMSNWEKAKKRAKAKYKKSSTKNSKANKK